MTPMNLQGGTTHEVYISREVQGKGAVLRRCIGRNARYPSPVVVVVVVAVVVLLFLLRLVFVAYGHCSGGGREGGRKGAGENTRARGSYFRRMDRKDRILDESSGVFSCVFEAVVETAEMSFVITELTVEGAVERFREEPEDVEAMS